MRIAFATCEEMPGGSVDDHATAGLIGAEYRPWSDPRVDWSVYDRVILRSVWDYTLRAEDFLGWCDAVGAARLRNAPELVRWNADKRYLADLAAPTVPTTFVGPGDAVPALSGEVVVKPNVSAGAVDTGRFTPQQHEAVRELIARIHASGRVALVQPYLAEIEQHGETALVFLGGELSHVLAKRPVLRDHGEPPVAEGDLRAAAVMFEDDLVVAGIAAPDQLAFARTVYGEIAARFGPPLYARIDLVRGPGGQPLVLELEMIEPHLYLATAPGAAARFAGAITLS